MESSTSYQSIYQTLPKDSIRILSLLPGKSGSEIQCTLSQIPMYCADGRHPYEALSYMWGPPEPTSLIQLNGQPFTVRANLIAALELLRYEDRPRRSG
jgi:hypothetical protein